MELEVGVLAGGLGEYELMNDLKTLRQLVKLMVDNDLTEIDLEGEGEKIKLKRSGGGDVQYVAAPPAGVVPAAVAADVPADPADDLAADVPVGLPAAAVLVAAVPVVGPADLPAVAKALKFPPQHFSFERQPCLRFCKPFVSASIACCCTSCARGSPFSVS